MCAFTTAAGCIECRVIWKRKRRSCPGCIGFRHGHVLENPLRMGVLGDRQQQWRYQQHGYKYPLPRMKQEKSTPTSISMAGRGTKYRGEQRQPSCQKWAMIVFGLTGCQMTRYL